MADTYSGIAITVLGDPDIPRTATSNVTERHIPWGNVNYVDLGGQNMPHLKLTLRWTATADYLTFEALVGTSNSLVYADGTYTAILVSATRKNHGVLNTVMEHECDFILVSSP